MSFNLDIASLLNPEQRLSDGILDWLKSDYANYDQATANLMATQDYRRLAPILQSHPEILNMLNDTLPLVNGRVSGAIEYLGHRLQEAPANQVYADVLKSRQFALGQKAQTMGNADFAAFQQRINNLAPRIEDADWNKMVADLTKEQGGGADPAAIWRDPTTGAGVAVRIEPGKNIPAAFVYFDRSGKSVDTSIFQSPELYSNAEKYGINLRGISDIGKQLEAKNLGYLPGQLYPGTGSNHGINFSDIENGWLGSAYDWTVDPKAYFKGPTATDYIKNNEALVNRLKLSKIPSEEWQLTADEVLKTFPKVDLVGKKDNVNVELPYGNGNQNPNGSGGGGRFNFDIGGPVSTGFVRTSSAMEPSPMLGVGNADYNSALIQSLRSNANVPLFGNNGFTFFESATK